MVEFDHEISMGGISWAVFSRIQSSYKELLLQMSQIYGRDNGLLSCGSMKKKTEYAASRLLLAYVSRKKGFTFWGVSKDKKGAPYPTHASYAVSITHDYPYVGVGVGQHQMGVDVEKVSDQAYRVQEKFLSKYERLNCKNKAQATLYWSAKESVYKSKKGAVRSYRDIEIVPQKIEKESGNLYVYIWPEERTTVVGYFFVKGYVCTYTSEHLHTDLSCAISQREHRLEQPTLFFRKNESLSSKEAVPALLKIGHA